ncbi:sphingomyelin phosphodiesterase [Laetiporus sulphureus 93-53]|uniref:Sphingomyelin phosphodiesterase n=1 Tax=Laetiporus sulphureus 93-53 TaxID=1314785 RepID=A0A165F733_9APHY|nr:sphingomyelin phosphodiesterase [Laetiporus sulphureus 93-53]KZT08514.1 sphingomyelin phosphodiesterase [Laetiporus sulphureus 93-53]
MAWTRASVLTALVLPSLVACGLVDQVERALATVRDCGTCHAALPTFKTLAALGDERFVQTITAACIDMKIEDSDVCEGAIRTQGPILAHDLRHFTLGRQTATKFCEAVFGMCAPPPVNSYDVPFPKPAPEHPKEFVSRGRPPFRVMHFSDMHIDRQYEVNSESKCTKPLCCRTFGPEPPSHIKLPALPFGMRTCDAPGVLADTMLDAAENFGAGAKFSIFTGDVIDHAVWDVDENGVSRDMQVFSDQMATKLSAPLFPALGNHESAPTNSFPRNTTEHEITAEWVFNAQRAGWSQWIGPNATEQIRHYSGSYSTVAPSMDLRIISVNTQYWYKQNFWLYDSDEHQPDPNGILAFLVEELQAAEDAGERAWIIAHMPPGRGDVMRDQSVYFDQVLQRYKNTIVGQFYGHTHADEFAIGYSNYSERTAANAIGVAMIGPAMTPMSGNPAFKVYDVDPDTFEIMDAKTYYTSIFDPEHQLHPKWHLLYSARETYGPLVPSFSDRPDAPLNPAFWHDLTEVFRTNDRAFQMYIAHKPRGREFVWGSCEGACKEGTLCEMRTLRSDVCGKVSGPVFHLPDGNGRFVGAQMQSCEGHGIGHILKSLAKTAPEHLAWVEAPPTIFEEQSQQVLNG